MRVVHHLHSVVGTIKVPRPRTRRRFGPPVGGDLVRYYKYDENTHRYMYAQMPVVRRPGQKRKMTRCFPWSPCVEETIAANRRHAPKKVREGNKICGVTQHASDMVEGMMCARLVDNTAR